MLDLLLRVLVGLLGITLILTALMSAIRNFVLPRAASEVLGRLVFRTLRRVFDKLAPVHASYEWRDRVLAFYGPIGLLLLPLIWNILACLGFACLYWAVGVGGWWDSLRLSGSSLLTLGFATPERLVPLLLVFANALIGPLLVSLLISYLPTIYGAFSRRELLVTQLEVRAGAPSSPLRMILLYQMVNGLERMKELWPPWEVWFNDVSESHTSLPVLTFFRSPKSNVSWVTAAGTILDAASLMHSCVRGHDISDAGMCIRSGFLALRNVANYFGIQYNEAPSWQDPISISRDEFDDAYAEMQKAGIDVHQDRDACWRNYCGWRVNYDTVLLALAGLIVAPPAMWSSDRSRRPTLAPLLPRLRKAP